VGFFRECICCCSGDDCGVREQLICGDIEGGPVFRWTTEVGTGWGFWLGDIACVFLPFESHIRSVLSHVDWHSVGVLQFNTITLLLPLKFCSLCSFDVLLIKPGVGGDLPGVE